MIYSKTDDFAIYHGDNRQVLPTLAENSVDAIVTDPPYELGFMGKSWDASGIAFNVDVWREALRVLKPGGHLIAFSGSRTYHRMAVAIEDAGFEIRDQIMWVYGSGFPKSHNISKGIDKAAGAEREVVGAKTQKGGWHHEATINDDGWIGGNQSVTAPATPAAKQWDGWGTALKPAHEPMVLARKPVIGTVANNVLTYGVGGLNIDGARVGTTVETWPASRSFASGISSGFTEGLEKGATQATGDVPAGRWPANFIHDGSDEVVALFPKVKGATSRTPTKPSNATSYVLGGDSNTPIYDDGLNTSAARFFYCAKASKRDRNEGLDGFKAELKPYGNRKEWQIPEGGDVKGSVNDKFTTQPQANNHPTVKPTDLMRYLCRLVTPPNGTVLDPFMGSGSTGKAAMYEGFKFIGVEMTEEYLPIAKARIEFAVSDNEGFLL